MPTSSGRTAGWRGDYHPDINPGDAAAPSRCTGRSARRTRRWSIRIGGGEYDTAGGRPAAEASSATFEFSGFDFSAAAHGPQAATFTELFADVLHPTDSQRDPSRPERGADLHAAVTVSFEEAMRGVERQVVGDPAGCAARALWRDRSSCGRRSALCARATGPASVRWARGHMVFTKSRARLRRDGTSAERSGARSASASRPQRCAPKRSRCTCRRASQQGSGCGSPGSGHAGRNGGAQRRPVRHGPRPAASGLPARRRRPPHA